MPGKGMNAFMGMNEGVDHSHPLRRGRKTFKHDRLQADNSMARKFNTNVSGPRGKTTKGM